MSGAERALQVRNFGRSFFHFISTPSFAGLFKVKVQERRAKAVSSRQKIDGKQTIGHKDEFLTSASFWFHLHLPRNSSQLLCMSFFAHSPFAQGQLASPISTYNVATSTAAPSLHYMVVDRLIRPLPPQPSHHRIRKQRRDCQNLEQRHV